MTDAMPYLPDVQVVIPGRRGTVNVPSDMVENPDLFAEFLSQWGVTDDDNVSLTVEGMSRADGPVAVGPVWVAPTDDT